MSSDEARFLFGLSVFGLFCAAVGMAAGRLIWGVPKATAPIEASPLDDDFEDDEDDDDDFEAKLIRDPDAWRDR
jgi:hypothetical protein